MNKIRVALIWPYGFLTGHTGVFPLSLGYLASNIPTDRYEIKIINCALLNIHSNSEELKRSLVDFNPNVVGISSFSATYPEALAVAMLVKTLNPETVTILGGIHATANPQEVIAQEAFDFVFRGEGELEFPRFLDGLQDQAFDWKQIPGLVYRDADGQPVFKDSHVIRAECLDQIKIPDYGVTELRRYLEQGYQISSTASEHAPIWTTRGCPYLCSFCNAPLVNGGVVRSHGIPYLMDWVRHLYENYNIRQFNIIDDNFTFHKEFAKEFCRAVLAMNLPGAIFSTPNGVRMERGDFELWSLMKQAGWPYLIVAPESGSKNTLKLMKKRLSLDKIPDIIKEMRKAGLPVYGFFLIGYPGETPSDLELTRKFILKCDLSYFYINPFQVFPGTPIFEQLVRNGEIDRTHLPNLRNLEGPSYITKDLVGFNFTKPHPSRNT